jgi:hypothetical protein
MKQELLWTREKMNTLIMCYLSGASPDDMKIRLDIEHVKINFKMSRLREKLEESKKYLLQYKKIFYPNNSSPDRKDQQISLPPLSHQMI